MTLEGTVLNGVVVLDPGPTLRDGTRVEVLIKEDSTPSLRIQDLTKFLQALPRLGEDAAAFGDDVAAIRREFPSEASAWD